MVILKPPAGFPLENNAKHCLFDDNVFYESFLNVQET